MAIFENISEMMIGLDTLVELSNGKMVQAVNLDNAATTPAFKAVEEEIHNKLLMYGSIGRGVGQKSTYSTDIYDGGRDIVKDFVNASDKKYDVFYVNCTTDGMNKLASALIESPKDMVLCTRMEHHANDLPWRERAQTVYIDVDENGRLDIASYEDTLKKYEGRIKYVTVGAASNVTGYVNDVHDIAEIVHRNGAKIIVDGAQIVAHRAFSMKGESSIRDIDFFVFSAHKMYSPYGGGAVVGLADVLNERLPVFYGGGMVEAVSDYTVEYSPMPNRYEAGSPNYAGVVGMLKSMDILKNTIGFASIEQHEQNLLRVALDELGKMPEVILYGDSQNIADRVGLLAFNIKGLKNLFVAQYLADNYAIAVRHAKFCSHTYVDRLLRIYGGGEIRPGCSNEGMVRVSFGVYNTEDDVRILVDAVRELLNPQFALEQTEFDAVVSVRRSNDRG